MTFLLIFTVNVNNSPFKKKKGKIPAHRREAVGEKYFKSKRETGRQSFIIVSLHAALHNSQPLLGLAFIAEQCVSFGKNTN